MIVISDTSPLSALAEIDELELLPRLYGQVTIPEAVRREAAHPHAPRSLALGLANASNWLLVVPDPVPLLPETLGLDPGEAAAISLAWTARTKVMLIVDDKEGRKLCDALGLAKTGTAGVLLAAARAGFVDFETVMQRLQSTTFRLHPAVVEELRQRLEKPTT